MSVQRSVRVVALALLAPAALRAQDTTRLPADSAARGGIARAPLTVDGLRIRPGMLQYQVVVTTDSGPQVVGTHAIDMRDALHGGQPALQIVERRDAQAPFPAANAIDTVVVARQSLAPWRWDATIANARFAAAIANDTLYGGVTGPGARRSFTIPVAPLTITSEGALDAMLMAAALQAGWVADAVMAVADLDGPRLLGLRLQVEREERVAVPAGSFDAWVVSARSAGAEKWLWVDKETGAVVKTAQSPPHLPGMILERVLVGRAP